MLKILDLGRQPLANAFLDKGFPLEKEYFYPLEIGIDPDTMLVSTMHNIDPAAMFNDSYPYHSSGSATMLAHFAETANTLKGRFGVGQHSKVLEIGSNDGAFIKNFSNKNAICVEPCGNFAKVTSSLGYKTYHAFWTKDLARQIAAEHGKVDLIYAANCMCHIRDIVSALAAVSECLSDRGVFVFEDPSMLDVIKNTSYDQFYDEHPHIFSCVAISNILRGLDMKILDCESTPVHGGSNRIYIAKGLKKSVVTKRIHEELDHKMESIDAYLSLAARVSRSRIELIDTLAGFKADGKRIVSYGATSKSNTIFNYCGLDTDTIDYITDTTPAKCGKLSPGKHIPVVDYKTGFNDSVDVAFLGAWNFEKEIVAKEQAFLARGGVFVTHVPRVRTIGA